jgi:hypothetical protein
MKTVAERLMGNLSLEEIVTANHIFAAADLVSQGEILQAGWHTMEAGRTKLGRDFAIEVLKARSNPLKYYDSLRRLKPQFEAAHLPSPL